MYSSDAVRITSVLKESLDLVLDCPQLCMSSTHDLVAGTFRLESKKCRNNFSILSLFQIRSARSGQKLIVGGGDDGSISFWDQQYAFNRIMTPDSYYLFEEP